MEFLLSRYVRLIHAANCHTCFATSSTKFSNRWHRNIRPIADFQPSQNITVTWRLDVWNFVNMIFINMDRVQAKRHSCLSLTKKLIWLRRLRWRRFATWTKRKVDRGFYRNWKTTGTRDRVIVALCRVFSIYLAEYLKKFDIVKCIHN